MGEAGAWAAARDELPPFGVSILPSDEDEETTSKKEDPLAMGGRAVTSAS